MLLFAASLPRPEQFSDQLAEPISSGIPSDLLPPSDSDSDGEMGDLCINVNRVEIQENLSDDDSTSDESDDDEDCEEKKLQNDDSCEEGGEKKVHSEDSVLNNSEKNISGHLIDTRTSWFVGFEKKSIYVTLKDWYM